MAGQKRSAKPLAKRQYQLRQRRASMDETRARIVDAALELFETVGPAATSMSGIAERAGVTRATLYRHFPGDAELANAVIDEWSMANPGVDPAALAAIADPTTRLRIGLAGLYGSYRATAALTANLLRDAHILPAERQEDLRAAGGRVRDSLAGAGFSGLPGRGPAVAAATLGHAVAFETWRSLSGEGLEDHAIVDIMVMLVTAAAPSDPARKAGKGKGAKKGKGEGKAKARRSRGA